MSSEINSIEDILNDDPFDLLGSTTKEHEIFNMKHISVKKEKQNADEVERAKPCKNFKKYEYLFNECQEKIMRSELKQINFKSNLIKENTFCVVSGIVAYILKIEEETLGSNGLVNNRTHIIFSNGTESHIFLKSLERRLRKDGKILIPSK